MEWDFYSAYAKLPPESIREFIDKISEGLFEELNEDGILNEGKVLEVVHKVMDKQYFVYKPKQAVGE